MRRIIFGIIVAAFAASAHGATSTAVSCATLQPIIAACSVPTTPFACPPIAFTTGAVYCVNPTGAVMGAVKPGTAAIVLEVWTGGTLTKSVPVVLKSPGGGFFQQLDPVIEGSARVLKGYTIGTDGTRTPFDANVCKTIPGTTIQSCLPGFPFTWQ